MEFGQPLSVSKEMLELYKIDKKEAISQLLDEIRNVNCLFILK